MPAIFRKTFKGLAELEDRTHGLTPRLRALLILVDGQRDAKALRTLWSQEVRPALAELQREGYIEPIGRPLRRLPVAFREPTTVILPPAPMADIEHDELPGFVPLDEGSAGHLDGAAGGVDLLLDDLGMEAGPPADAAAEPVPAPEPEPMAEAEAEAAYVPAPDPDPAPIPEAEPQAEADAGASADAASHDEADGDTAVAVATRPQQAPVAEPAPPLPPPPAPPPPRNPAFEARRRAAVRGLHEEVGDDPDPQVHDLSVRMVRAQTPQALQPLLVEGTQLVTRLRGRSAGEVYAMRFLA